MINIILVTDQLNAQNLVL